MPDDTAAGGRYQIEKFGEEGTPHPTSDYGILSRVERHLYEYLRHAKSEGWNDDAIQALESDIDQFESFQAHYNELVRPSTTGSEHGGDA